MNYSRTIVGWILVAIGVVLIVWTLFLSYNFFTGKAEITQIFSVPTNQTVQGTDVQAQLNQLLNEQLKSMIPVDAISKILNLTIWSMLAFIFIFSGTQIAGIGVKLMNKNN